MRLSATLLAGAALLAMGGCSTLQGLLPGADAPSAADPTPEVVAVAPGAPGEAPTWVNAAKTGAGASYEAYVDGQYRDGGPTSVENGILLCYWHHRRVDDGPWQYCMIEGVPYVRGPGLLDWTRLRPPLRAAA